MKLDYKFVVTVITIAGALSTAAYAADPKAKTKAKLKPLKPLPPGPAWVDTNHDGQLSNDEFKRARQMLDDKIKAAKSKSGKSTQPETKAAKSTKK
jgi:hypothetical protein